MLGRALVPSTQRLLCPTVRHGSAAVLLPPRRIVCRVNTESETDSDAAPSSSPNGREVLSEDEVRKLAVLRRQQQEQREAAAVAPNLLQGALEEARLITWPRPQKAFFDTLLVLAIVMGSGTLLLGVNVLLANGSEWWYHRG